MKLLFFIFSLLILILPKNSFANENSSDQFISIVNPVRISQYNLDPLSSLNAQYVQIKNRDLPATWLLTFDILKNSDIKNEVLKMDNKQELGIFMEVNENFASMSGVLYNKSDSWHRAKSIFLSGYAQGDRIKLIDKIFSEFKENFGYYPTSVGAWWIDSYSLSYMKEKYGVSAVLGCADQFSTDGYQLWGQYWSTAYYPSKIHTGMPANSLQNKQDVVMSLWAPRDPLNGYINPYGKNSSLYSTQDYHTVGLGEDYFEKLLNLYVQKNGNPYGFITVGLESDFSPLTYSGIFAKQMDLVKKYEVEGKAKILTMKDFSTFYRGEFSELSPAYVVRSDDLLGTNLKSFWYQSPNYRIGGVIDKENKKLKIVDLRTYHNNFEEPYNITPNEQLDLYINSPSIIDKVSNEKEGWEIDIDGMLDEKLVNEEYLLVVGNKQIEFSKDKISLLGTPDKIPENVRSSSVLDISTSRNSVNIIPRKEWLIGSEGFTFWDITPQGLAFLKQKKVIAVSLIIFSTLSVYLFFIQKLRKGGKKKIVLISLPCLFILIFLGIWVKDNSEKYYVSQAEIDALNRLKTMPKGNVLVFDKICLQCSWSSKVKPAVLANKRGYVEDMSHKTIVSDNLIFDTDDKKKAKDLLDKSKTKYIYLVKTEEYEEKIAFSPGDLNIEKIYANANAEIWKVRD